MPYITQDKRDKLAAGDSKPTTPGELNYSLSMVVKDYLETNGLSYQTINDIIGALEGAKLEFYRRIAEPYEDTKIEENGDVW